jgi:predicted Kef-type K+ transport protein
MYRRHPQLVGLQAYLVAASVVFGLGSLIAVILVVVRALPSRNLLPPALGLGASLAVGWLLLVLMRRQGYR